MRIVNASKKSTIALDYRPCTAMWQRTRGLMFTVRMEKPLLFAFWKERRWGLHMLFVFYPIDVLFLDKKRKVVDMKENLRPFAFYTPRRPCQYIIELPAGTIRKSRTCLGDSIHF